MVTATAEDIINAVLENLRVSVEPAHYTIIVPSDYYIYLHEYDYNRLESIIPVLESELKRVLDEELIRQNNKSAIQKILKVRKREWKALQKWTIRFSKSHSDEELIPGDVVTISRLLPGVGSDSQESITARINRTVHHIGNLRDEQIAFKYDIFISHASEDKESVARPLSVLLKARGLKVWLDENEITLGDNLIERIDRGLVASRYGVIILSEAFLSKEWPRRELNALVAKESGQNKVILPVWHNIDQDTVFKYSPILAGKIGANTRSGLGTVAEEIVKAITPPAS